MLNYRIIMNSCKPAPTTKATTTITETSTARRTQASFSRIQAPSSPSSVSIGSSWSCIGTLQHTVALSLVLAVVLLASFGCARTREEMTEVAYPGNFPEHIGKTWRTPTGVAVDGEANPNEIDWIVDNVWECLREAVPDRLTSDEGRAGLCYAKDGHRGPLEYPDRTDIVVKIGSWHPSCANPKRQVLDVEVPEDAGCDPNKPRPEGCPAKCYWRGGYRYVNGRHLHIAVPELSMLADTLTRQVTGCRDPYSIKRIRACAAWRRP